MNTRLEFNENIHHPVREMEKVREIIRDQAAIQLAMDKARFADRLAHQLERIGSLARFGHSRGEAVELRLMNGDLRDWADLVAEYRKINATPQSH